MILKREELTKECNQFLNVSTFKSRDIELPKDFLDYNTLIKGNRNSGKTDKVLIPSLKLSKHGVLYIDLNNEGLERVKEIAISNNTKLHVYNNETINIDKIIDNLLKGEYVYFNIRYNQPMDLLSLNKIMDYLKKNQSKERINIFIDNVQYLGKIKSLPDLILNKENIHVIMTICYTSQLETNYNEDIVNRIRQNVVSYDVNKQY